MTTATKTLKLDTYQNKHGHTFKAIEIDGILVSFPQKDMSKSREWLAKARVYGAVDVLAQDLDALEPAYVAYTDETSTDAERLQEKVWRTWRDGVKKVTQQRLSIFLQKLVDADIEDVSFSDDLLDKVTFSFKAGCSCGCSPGFILNGRVRGGCWNSDISFSTLDGLEKVES